MPIKRQLDKALDEGGVVILEGGLRGILGLVADGTQARRVVP